MAKIGGYVVAVAVTFGAHKSLFREKIMVQAGEAILTAFATKVLGKRILCRQDLIDALNSDAEFQQAVSRSDDFTEIFSNHQSVKQKEKQTSRPAGW
ncbi:MAG: hypothetical protein WC831_03325 [Parcubacteria group bacterium]